jgi:alanyl-tRNA synthetase
MTSAEIRERFLEYFEKRGHRRVPSSSLIPAGDPTLLFANAGMNQFKDVFTGREKRDYNRAASSQKCVRAGGKHNDLDNVGYTGRHHTFFEMLGNFSFGDYFKEDAIRFAWELLTDSRIGYGLEPARLWATVYDEDDEAARLWERWLPKERILRFGESENFWAMGETGPCGPCSEIHYFRGEDLSRNTPDLVNGPGDENVEVWNLVFMQFERDASGKMTPLPRPSVDTGMGLERLTAVLQGANNNFDTDLFRPILAKIGSVTGRTYLGNMAVEDAPFRVVADHARAVTMLMADGVLPANEGRGYVLRRIIRRALRYARHLGFEKPILSRLAPVVLDGFEGVYVRKQGAGRYRLESGTDLDADSLFGRTLRGEEERFGKTMSVGADRVGEAIEELRRRGEKALAGETVFRLYDTYGIPLEVIEEIASDEGLAVDRAGFEVNLEKQRVASRASAKFQAADASVYEKLGLPERHSEFRGYPELDFWRWPGGEARVTDTQKPVPGLVAHRVTIVSGRLGVGTKVDMEVPEWTRRRTQANHTGTHLLHAALRKVLGESARQMGSLVAPDRLRFDYAATAPTTPEQIAEVERLVNEEVLRDSAVVKQYMTMEESRRRGAIAFFGEKYGETVRVVDVPGFSTELCGGCHVPRTGEIGAFKIVSDRGLAAGVRRLEAVTALGAVELLRSDETTLNALSGASQTPREKLLERWQEREERVKALEREVASLKLKLASGDAGASGGTVEVDGIRLVTRIAAGLSIPELRNLSDTLRAKLSSGVVVVGTSSEGKTAVVAAVTPDLTGRLPASRIAARIGKALGGSGGGKADLAQAGGRNEDLLAGALKEAEAAVREMLSSPAPA